MRRTGSCTRSPLVAVVALSSLAGCAAPASQTLVDLTYPFDEHTIYWPTQKPFHREKTAWGTTPGGFWYASADFAASEHGGTHIDAPIHFGAGRQSVDEIPLERLVGPAVVIDVAAKCEANPDYELTVADITAWEARHGRIEPGALVLVYTGWGRRWPDPQRYLGTATPGDAHSLHFPGMGREAAAFLVVHRRVRGVGIDTASIDPGRSRDFQTHRVLNEANVYALENVAALDRLPPRGATVYALPIKIKGGTGGPVRILAVLP